MEHTKNDMAERIKADMRLLGLLAQNFPSVEAACTEIINLEAILNLPKGTEHFMADIHGEHEAFEHILRNASGNIKRKVRELYGKELSEERIRELCTLIYYPEEKLELLEAQEEELPAEFREYIAFMESYLGVPIKIISVGPDREATIMR